LLDSIQEKIASGNNYSRPSDDPVAARLLVGINDKLTAGEQYENNIKKAEIWLNMTSTALEGMVNYTNQAKSMAASLSSGTTDSNIRDSAISQLQAIKQQLVDMGNTQLNGVYLFGGGLNSTAPFTTSASGGPPATYYHGDETTLQVEISPGSTETMNMIGSQVLSASEATLQPYGSTSILGTIDQLITDITANNVTGIQAGIQSLYQGGKQLESAQSAVATRLLRLDGARSMNESTKNTLETVYSNVQNADYAKLAVQLTQQQTAFEATLAATAKISQLSLLDYL
jgi:flagellar hook-associated protein 3 FlgL